MKKLGFLLAIILYTSALFSQETLKIDWPKDYEWKLISNHEDDKMQVLEIIPGNDKADAWSLLGQMMVIKGSTQISMEKAKTLMFDQTKVNAPKAVLTEIERNEDLKYPWILFKIECPNFINDPNPESQLWYITRSDNALYVNFIAKKVNQLSSGHIDMWSNIFKKGKIVKE